MFEVGTSIQFPAQHVMPGVEGPEGVLHSHNYRLEVVVEREKLDADAVTVEVFARWAHDFLAAELRGSGAEVLSVRVWESASAFGGYRDRLD